MTLEKNKELSKIFLLIEIFLNIVFLLIIISGFFLPYLPKGMFWNIPLLIFLGVNSLIKVLCLKYNYSIKKRAILHIPLLVYLLIILISGIFSGKTIILKILFFTIIFVINLKFNYFVKFKISKN